MAKLTPNTDSKAAQHIFHSRPATLVDLLEYGFAKFGDAPAFTNAGKTLTYADVDKLSRAFAAYLQSIGLQQGDRIAIMLPNLLQYPVALFGIIRAGLTATNINPLYTPRELQNQLIDSGAKAIVILSELAPTLLDVLDKTAVERIITTDKSDLLGEAGVSSASAVALPDPIPFKHALVAGAQLALTPATVWPQDIAFLQYTGGTTGLAKGAALSHANLTANIAQTEICLRQTLSESSEVVITALPVYHIFALTVNCLYFFKLGGHDILITNPRDLPGFVEELKKWPFSAITGVNTLFNGLLHTPGFSELDFSNLRLCIGGGMAVQEAVATKWHKVTGVAIAEGYGLSETSPVVSINPPELGQFTGSIGLPVYGTDVSVRDNNGNDLGRNECGELCVRGPQVMRGYWQKPDANKAAFYGDGFFRTGDVATRDDAGYIRIVDRKKDLILVSGFNVYPNEVEEVAAACDGVLECACTGVPNEKTGEAVKLYVVREEGSSVSASQIREYCAQYLTRYKIPAHIEFIAAIPKSAVGKILRRELRPDKPTS